MVVILNNIRSLYNVGSIFRTADAAGAEKIYLCGITPAPLDRFGKVRPQFQKVALGAERFVAWEKASSVGNVIKHLKKEGFNILAIEQSKRSVPYYSLINTSTSDASEVEVCCNNSWCYDLKKTALVLGSETKGLPPTILKRADVILEIPMRGRMVRQALHPKNLNPEQRRGKESLNVAVAFGIVVFHLVYSK